MGFALSSSPEKPRVAYLNQVPPNRATIKLGEESINIRTYTEELLGAIQKVPVENRDQAVEKVKSGAAVAALVIPPDFAVKLSSGGFSSAEIEVIYNGDALKLSLVDSTITAKLAAADAELSGQISRLANGYIDVLLDGGAIDVLGTNFPILGLKNSTARIDAVLADNATAANKRRLGPVSKFAHLALANAGRATAVLSTVQEPVQVERTILSGRRTPLDAFAVAVAVTMSLMFVCVLLASGPARARARGEHVLPARARPRLRLADPRRQGRCSRRRARSSSRSRCCSGSASSSAGPRQDRALAHRAVGQRDRVRDAGRRDRLARARGAGGVAAGVRARAADRVPRARAERRRRAAALRHHPA